MLQSKVVGMSTSHKSEAQVHRQYWRRNLTVMAILLGCWALVGLGGGIIFADVLNKINIPRSGLPFGFWIAHQGSIIGFVFIILVYCVALNYLDRNHRKQIRQLKDSRRA